MRNSTMEGDFLGLKKIAVVGASNDREKYGNIVFRRLLKEGYNAFPLNPKASSVEGHVCYPSLKDLPERVEGIVCVVPPPVTEEIVREAIDLQIRDIWMQPGSQSVKAVEDCTENGLNCISEKCILVELNKLG